ncbi:MAG: hypothetical protein JXA90_03260, partial [Planctomycetes bacterium]|nr:hypothetical protein [Planctomycetota bacterium]
MSRSLLVVAGLVWGSCWAGVRPAAAAEPSLASIVPSDVHFYGHWRSTPEQSRLLEPYAKAVRRLVDSGIGRDIFDLATLDMPSWQRDEARAIAQRVIEIVKTPRWGKLIEKEIAGAFRLAIPLPEYLYLFRVPPEDAAGH